jgi:hypothetical protein
VSYSSRIKFGKKWKNFFEKIMFSETSQHTILSPNGQYPALPEQCPTCSSSFQRPPSEQSPVPTDNVQSQRTRIHGSTLYPPVVLRRLPSKQPPQPLDVIVRPKMRGREVGRHCCAGWLRYGRWQRAQAQSKKVGSLSARKQNGEA